MIPGCIVLRVSTEDQDPANQLHRCRALAEAMGVEVKRVLKAHESGRWDPSPRRDALRLVREGKVKRVIVWDLDRWSRQGPRAVLNDVAEIAQADAALLSVNQPWIGQEGVGELLLVITAWWAKEEAKKTARRTREALDRIKRTVATEGNFRARKSGKVRARLGRPSAIAPEVLAWAVWYRAEGASWKGVQARLKADGLGEYSRPTLSNAVRRQVSRKGVPTGPPRVGEKEASGG